LARLNFPGDRKALIKQLRLRSRAEAVRQVVSPTELAKIGARLAGNIKAWRLERGMTQNDVALQLGVSSVLINKFENGKIRVPVQRLIQLSRALRLPVAALLVGVSPELDDAARLVDRAAVRLIRAFTKVDNLKTRESIVEEVEQIAAQQRPAGDVSGRPGVTGARATKRAPRRASRWRR
jgi:transcriptional regulator with XRE-family HTH domain